MKTLLFVVLLTYCAFGADSINTIKEMDGNKNTHNEVDDTVADKKGFAFYDDGQVLPNGKKSIATKATILQLLKEIRDENKKQSAYQKEIRDMLSNYFDPKPKTIIKNGHPCIANSSGDCMDYKSLLTPEAKKVPALAEALADPYDMNKIANYLQWQAAYFKHNFNIGNAFQMAQEQWGDKVNPLGTKRSTFDSIGGVYNAKILPRAQKKYINELGKKKVLQIGFFLGIDKNLDIYGMSGIAEILRENPDVEFTFYFKDNESKILFEDGMNTLYGDKNKHWKRSVKKIGDKSFKEYDIFTSPSIVAILDDKKTNTASAQIISVGRTTNDVFIQRVINFLQYKKVYDYKRFSDSKIWKDNSNGVVKDYYQRNYHVDIKTEKDIKKGGFNEKK